MYFKPGDALYRVYIETSALNALQKRLETQDAIATKAHLNVKGKGWYISPVVLWEILATADAIRREELIFFAQHLFEEKLLPSPEEIIVNYIRAGCPTIERKYDFVSTGPYAAPWADICQIKTKTIVFDAEHHKKVNEGLRKFCKLFYTFSRFDSIDIAQEKGAAIMQIELQQLIDRFGVTPKHLRGDATFKTRYRIVAFFILSFLCAGAGIEPQITNRYWEKLGISDMQRKIEYIFSELQALFTQGPVVMIAQMTEVQMARKFSRGMLFDCLHSIYSVYSDLFVSNDEHFRSLRTTLRDTYQYEMRIRLLDELEMTSIRRDNPLPKSFLAAP